MTTCRFCHKYASDHEVVKYGVRHYAHFACYLDAGKTLAELRPWKVSMFPSRVLQDRGLLEQAAAIVDKDDARRMVS